MEIFDAIIEKLTNANHVVVLTGAGISAESGIKTFRDPDGLWAKFNPAELASIDGFMANPGLVWSWYNERRSIIAESIPNQGHYAIAEMQSLFNRFNLITQNVDRLHQTAGSINVTELHGNIIDNHCFNCKKLFDGEIDLSQNEPPKCLDCGGMIRPSVVWFGEMLPVDAINYAQEVAYQCDLFLCAGTSAEVYPAANLPIIAKKAGAYVVEINPNETAISPYMDEVLRGPSGIILPELLRLYKGYIKSEK